MISRKRKRKTLTRSKLYVAVVCSKVALPTTLGLVLSGRAPMGDWAGFIGDNKEKVIERALIARTKWSASGNYGPYEIYAGVLLSLVNESRKYEESKLA